MQTEQVLLRRRSVRVFSEKKVDRSIVEKILLAGQSGPSCVNSKDWYFIVVEDRATLEKMREANGAPARPLQTAAFAVLVCGDKSKSYQGAPDYFSVDASIATQNMIIMATDLGVGSVWLGTWPQQDRVEKQREIFSLPKHIVPHSIVAFGYTDEPLLKENEPILDASTVRFV